MRTHGTAMAVLVLGLVGCGGGSPEPTPSAVTPPAPERIEAVGLHNVLRIHDRLYSGSSPEGDAGFASLQKLGVKVVLSVDGARPDLERAHKFGLKYVHIPIGYNGISRTQAVQIARAVREAPGPVYLHCHHGKHRGPAAAAVARRCLDERCTTEEALDVLRRAGTDPRYAGLFRSVEEFRSPASAELAGVAVAPEAAEVGGLTQAMVALDHAWDNLKLARAAGWKTPPNHPDIDPAHEALQLLESYRELRRLPEVSGRPDDFRRWTDEGQASAADLERLLRAAERDAIEKAYQRAANLCAQCHTKYRDAP